LKALDGSQYEWIKDLLFVFNAGDLGKYDTLQGRLQEEASRRRGQCLKSGDQRLIRHDWNPSSLSVVIVAVIVVVPLFAADPPSGR